MRNQIHKDINKHSSSHYFISLSCKLDTPLHKGCIIDIETTGLNPASDQIITLGIIKKKLLLIYQLIHEDSYHRFHSLCHRVVKEQPIPRYGYACRFEADFLKILDDDWQDLTQHFEVDSDPPYRRYSLASVTRHPFPNEPIDMGGSQVPVEWTEYLKTKNTIHLANIVYHAVCDLHRTKQLVEKNK